jgi:hypothetical protein
MPHHLARMNMRERERVWWIKKTLCITTHFRVRLHRDWTYTTLTYTNIGQIESFGSLLYGREWRPPEGKEAMDN